MGKAGSSCLKIITCGGRSAENDEEDMEVAEGRAPTDKRRWSFGKKSAKHRVLSNTIITEPLSVPINSKGIPETGNNYFHTPKNVEVPEKIPVCSPEKVPVVKFVEEAAPASSPIVEAEVIDPLPVADDTNHFDASLHESSVIVIQTAVRGYLAKKEVAKHKHAIKIQAVVRGHLVRRQAVGTLRCVQAVLKMQALVRARRLRQYVEKLDGEKMLNANLQTDLEGSNFLDKENYSAQQNKICSSTRKVMANKFTRQILEATPGRKPIHISCEPSKSDSAWKWLERWMAVATSYIDHQHEPTKSDLLTSGIGNKLQADFSKKGGEAAVAPIWEVPPEITQMKASSTVASEPNHNESDMPINDQALPGEDIESQAPKTAPNMHNMESRNDQKQLCIQSKAKVMETEELMKTDTELEVINLSLQQNTTASNPPVHPDSPSEKRVVDLEKSKRTKRTTVEPLETEGKKFGIGLRKSCNPAFAAVQSKFEELSTISNPARSISSSRENVAEPKPDSVTIHATADPNLSKMHHIMSEPRSEDPAPEVSAESKVNNTMSKISIQLKQDDLTNEDAAEPKLDCLVESKPNSLMPKGTLVTKPGNNKPNDNSDSTFAKKSVSLEPRAQIATSECGTEISISSTLDSPDRSEADGGEIVLELGSFEARNYPVNYTAEYSRNNECSHSEPKHSHTAKDSYQQQNADGFLPVNESLETEKLLTDQITLGTSVSLENAAELQKYIPSPAESPRSHITAVESHGTPSSQVSSITKKSKVSNNVTANKQKSQVTSKRSSSNTINDSATKNSTQHLPKDQKNGKRRNSLGMKPDQIDREPRISSIPSYMQATQSAKAKVNASISPKASPDVHEKERKRHSLPIGNDKQDSPRIQRSTSQVQHGSQGNGTNSPHNSAERRWQR